MLLPRLLRPLPIEASGVALPPLPAGPVAVVSALGGVHLGEVLARIIAERASWDRCAWLRDPPEGEGDTRRAVIDSLGFRRAGRDGALAPSLAEAFASSPRDTVLVVESDSRAPGLRRLAGELTGLAEESGVKVLLASGGKRSRHLERLGVSAHQVDTAAFAIAAARDAGLGDAAIEQVRAGIGRDGAALVDLAAACRHRGVEPIQRAISGSRRRGLLTRLTRQLLLETGDAEREALAVAVQTGYWHPQFGAGSVGLDRLHPWVVPLEHDWGWVRPLWRPVLRRELARSRPTTSSTRRGPAPAPTPTPVQVEWRPVMDVRMLGTFEVRVDGRLVDDLSGQLAGSLLRYLLLRPDATAHRDELIERFWPEADPQRARNRLHVALSALRRALRRVTEIDIVELKDGAYRINRRFDLHVDVAELERSAGLIRAAAERDDPVALTSAAREAVAHYRGPLCPDLPYEEWTIYPRERLRMVYADALESLVAAQWASGDYEGCLETAHRMLDEDPCREDTHRLVMRCYCGLGRHPLALRQYESCRRILQATLGAAPSSATIATYNRAREAGGRIGS